MVTHSVRLNYGFELRIEAIAFHNHLLQAKLVQLWHLEDPYSAVNHHSGVL